MTISKDTPSPAAFMFAVLGGRFRLRLTEDNGPGRRYAQVLDGKGEIIGDASDFIYNGSGFAVHTAPFAGYVPVEQIEFVT
jgi:hypothetical protein